MDVTMADTKMYGWERLTGVCGWGCKVMLRWAPTAESLPYDAVERDDAKDISAHEPVTSEPQKPVWSDMKIGAPIVKNKSNSMANIFTEKQDKPLISASVTDIRRDSARFNENRLSKASSSGSSDSVQKTESKEVLHVTQMVSVV